MADEIMADVEQEGKIDLKPETENDNSELSPDEKNEADDAGASDQLDKKEDDPDKDKPFHQHPRWKERETEWDRRYNEQETRHQDDLKKMREEFGTAKKDNAGEVKIPSWFGGNQEQFDAYRADRDAEIKTAAEWMMNREKSAKLAEQKAVDDATAYMQGEVTSIEGDKKLNPDGKKIDPNKLLKIVMENDLIDSKGRWNYRAGFKIMEQASTTSPKNGDKKFIAGATTSEARGESKLAGFKTSNDFKKNRPW
jgi:hypothetical protein